MYFCAQHKRSLYAFGHTKVINSITQLLVLISDMSDFDSIHKQMYLCFNKNKYKLFFVSCFLLNR